MEKMMEQKIIKLELSVDDVNNSLAGVSNLPYNVAAPLIEKIRGQALPQVDQPTAPVAEAIEQGPQLLTEAE
jgi:16S rRNA A1518/A1519 N6-dimethyltransferase RsmA/KsgA/DIM1 with predicted DNA glycosylase/AP lyase activity